MSIEDSNCGTRKGGPVHVANWKEAAWLTAQTAQATLLMYRGTKAKGFRLHLDADAKIAALDLPCGEHVVVGRHSRCRLSLGEPTLALRALLVRAVEGDDGHPELRLYDLETGQGFEVDGQPGRRLGFASQDITTVRLGGRLLAAVPFGAGAGRRVMGNASPERPEARRSARAVEELMAFEATGIHLIPRQSVKPWLEVELRSPRGSERWQLSRSDLESPVLVGRYERCAGNRASTLTALVSRVHVALIAEADDVLVLDLASTNGIRRAGKEATSFRVKRRARIALSDDDTMFVRRVDSER